ncbi:hypothetical protein BDZ97DRAFT_1733710 [Flammula alnicola]|nr:hypothetical protein BDZ97DRAFT_1733710 [Flammula alnicola]
MLLILSLLYLVRGGIHAAPTTSLFRDTPTSNLSFPPCTCPDQRTIWDILWSCFSTVFACSWVAVHPNIPAPGTKWWRVALTRLELMVWTLISPEMMILWAMRQWFGARRLGREYKDKGWTTTHGHFMQMGGFMTFEGEAPKGVLSYESLEDLLDKGKIKFPNITEEEILDRSKGDALSKTLVVGQTAWFVAQCISRKAQGLVTTELELVTLGYAVLNGFMYFFWWNKPLGIRTFVPVYLLDTPTDNADSTEKAQVDGVQEANNDGNNAESATSTGIATRGAHSTLKDALTILSKIFYHWPVKAVVAFFRRQLDVILEGYSGNMATGAMQVHTFYTISTINRQGLILTACISLIGMVFGATHCAGWNFLFPSHAELIFWRISSLVITAIPFSMAVVAYLAWALGEIYQSSNSAEPGWLEPINLILVFIFLVCIPLYVLARFALLVEAFVALRNLSPGALAVVRWTSFLPHI